MENFRSGYVSIIGRPNVGKSTLLNSAVGEKVSIVTSRAQTTRKKIIGIRTSQGSQLIFIDTPGIHKPSNKLGECMVREAKKSLEDADVILVMVEPQPAGAGDRFILNFLKESGTAVPVFLIINKIDLVKKKEILPLIDEYSRLYPFETVLPISSLNPDDVKMLVDAVEGKLPQGPRYYSDDIITDQYERSLVAEIIREKVMEATKDEVPHAVAVEIQQWVEREDGLISVSANIYVERQGQKGIIIGKDGGRLKSIGIAARVDAEGFLGRRVFMQLWVKVREDWRNDEKKLRELGFE